MKYKGYLGKILIVDLTNRKTEIRALEDQLAEEYIGGRGFAVKILYDELVAGVDPLSDQNKLLFITGPVVGTLIPTSARFALATKSPLTCTLTTGYCGGHFGPEIKFAGYDGFLITGKSDKPVYLYIEDSNIEFVDASHLWGKDTIETAETIKEEKGKQVQVACIGLAGENMVRYASVMHDQHAAGRGGPGAVFGSKNLKAVVVKGSGGVPTALSVEGTLEESRMLHDTILGHPVYKAFRQFGTTGMMPTINEIQALPAENFRKTYFKETVNLKGEEIEKLVTRYESCWGCPVACSSVVEFKDEFGNFFGERIEHESLWSLGPLCNVGDLKAIIRASDLCDRFGMDTMTAGATIAFAIECFEKGYITITDVDGRHLDWGNSENLEYLVDKIAKREGIGKILAEGSMKAGQMIGNNASELAMHVKGMEIAAYDPRGFKGMALNYATTSRGADHNRAFTIAAEFLGLLGDYDRHSEEGKAELVKRMQDSTCIIDSAIMCMFTVDMAISVPLYASSINIATGMNLNEKDIYHIGERISNLERLFNLREGIDGSTDCLPARLKEIASGDGHTVDVGAMVAEYYKVRQWDEDGVPTREILNKLNL
jgi:aldehyde:ferredoxin oxidoreductase